MFSPFRTDDGAPKQLADVMWNDLSQLRNLDEGFVLEFKRSYTDTVQKKIPKIIGSFSNSRGGWLIIGIADDDKSICPIPRAYADYSQIIGELCRRHVSPTPRFDARFVVDPANAQQGVLVVQVFEGDFPPYVADGVVEVREGSTSGPAASSALVELYDKATKRRAEVDEFCQRTVYYPAACGDAGAAVRGGEPGRAGGRGRAGHPVPLFNLYLYRLGRRSPDAPSRREINDHAATMRATFARLGRDCHLQHAHDSLIFRASRPSSAADVHSAIELFADESIKLSVPAVDVAGEELVKASRQLSDLGLSIGPEDRFIDARETLRRVTGMASLLDHYVRARGIVWQQYAVAYELENMAGVMLWSDSPVYLEYVRRRGPLFCGTTDGRSRVRYLDDGEHDSFRARQFAGSHFFEACGLPLGSNDAGDNALVDALLSGR